MREVVLISNGMLKKSQISYNLRLNLVVLDEVPPMEKTQPKPVGIWIRVSTEDQAKPKSNW